MPNQQANAELLIIGGGVIGLSIAYHCALADIDVVLVERDQLGAATSAQTADMVRGYLPKKPHDSALAVRSIEDYRSFATTTGVDVGMGDLGVMTVLTSPEMAAELEAELSAQRDAGLDLELITAEEARARNPWLAPDGIEGAIWSPQAYTIKADEIVRGYATAAQKHGARLLTDTNVTGVDARTGQVTTSAGDFTAQAIVIAAGPWSGEVGKLAGLDVPVSAQFSEVLRTKPLVSDRAVDTPFTFHPGPGLKTKGVGSSFIVGMEDRSKQAGMRDAWFEAAVEEVALRYPKVEDRELRTAWTGTLDATPSKTAVIGQADGEHDRILFAAGYTGHGLGQAPMSGRIIRDLYLGRDPGVDLARFSIADNAVIGGSQPAAQP